MAPPIIEAVADVKERKRTIRAAKMPFACRVVTSKNEESDM
jgi:hypothetical protein